MGYIKKIQGGAFGAAEMLRKEAKKWSKIRLTVLFLSCNS